MPDPTPTPPEVDPPVPDPSPGPPKDEKPSGKIWTDDEVKNHVESKLKGQGKELTKAQKELEELRKWRESKEAESLTEQEKQAKRTAELEQAARERDELKQEKAARLERIAERNAERVKALPKDAKETARKWADRMDAESFAEFLDDLDRQVAVRDVAHGGRVAPSPEEMTDEQWEEHMKGWGQRITRGQKPEEGKKK